jgi:hypothetical protein
LAEAAPERQALRIAGSIYHPGSDLFRLRDRPSGNALFGSVALSRVFQAWVAIREESDSRKLKID